MKLRLQLMSLIKTFHGILDREFMKLSHLQRHINNIETVTHLRLILKSRSKFKLKRLRPKVDKMCLLHAFIQGIEMI